MRVNYQKMMDEQLDNISRRKQKPTLLLHSCCAPCSSYVLEYLSAHFLITILYYNPNIAPENEFSRRAEEQQRLIDEMPLENPVQFLLGRYDPDEFRRIATGREAEKEGGERCFSCYRLRLEEAAATAAEHRYDYFTTTLSISPHKNAQKLNEIGEELSKQYGIPYLYADFKKKNGYKRSCELSAIYHLYRQDYCGCVYSKAEAAQREKIASE